MLVVSASVDCSYRKLGRVVTRPDEAWTFPTATAPGKASETTYMNQRLAVISTKAKRSGASCRKTNWNHGIELAVLCNPQH